MSSFLVLLYKLKVNKMNENKEKLKTFSEKLHKPILKYGCLPATIIFVLLIVKIFTGNNKKIDFDGSELKSDIVVNDFCLLTINELETKYGKASKETQAGDSVYSWTLNKDHNIRVILFNTGEKRDIARFFHFELTPFFWDSLGWDKGDIETNDIEQSVYVRNLNGIDEALYKAQTELLDIKLKDDLSNFGKKQ